MRSTNFSLIIAIVSLGIVMTILRPETFLSTGNLINIALASVLIGLCALPQTLVILTGGIDISIGSNVGLSSVVCALVATNVPGDASGPLAIFIAVAVGTVCGMFNAAVITFGRVSPLIATLGTFTAFQGVTYIVTQGRASAVTNPVLSGVNSTRIFEIPLPVFVLVVLIVLFALFMRFTDFGRNLYAVGGNPVAARLAGLNVNRYIFGIYTVVGCIGGVAGVILTAKQGAGVPASGAPDLALQSITAVVLGGALLTGGVGTIFGTVLGVIIMGILQNGLLLLSVNALYQPVPQGLLLIIAVLIQQRRGKLRLAHLFRLRPENPGSSSPINDSRPSASSPGAKGKG
jgi:ribose/xylose/arabinose/galactoside ABC-type transport system permease subunit